MITSLKPALVWDIFAKICAIPHPSHHEDAIAQFIINFANDHHIDVKTDEVGNILLTQTATKGMESAPIIALQAHMDMVPQKNSETIHDFLTDPIEPYIDGDWVKAKNTTLGADNGIGLASALAALIDPSIQHGPLEVLVTRSEETGMIGAFGLKPNWLKSSYLINTDSEEVGEIFIGCAGGIEFQATQTLIFESKPNVCDANLRIWLKGLRGGHSGCDIDKGRGNAIKLLVRFLAEFAKPLDYRINQIKGGSLRNALPREAYVDLTFPQVALPELNQLMEQYELILKQEFGEIEPSLSLTIETLSSDAISHVWLLSLQEKLIDFLNIAPHGVIRMDQNLNVVETSLNLGVIEQTENHLEINFMIRSQLDSALDEVVSRLTSLSNLAGIPFSVSGRYCGWKPELSSKLLSLAQAQYKRLFNTVPKTNVIHAGLECGLFKQSYPMLEMISIGPTIVSPHSPNERVEIKSVEIYWNWLISILKNAQDLTS